MVQDGDGRPRKLAAPAPMHTIKPLTRSGNVKEPGLTFGGVSFIVDVCSDKAMIVLVRLKGVLDLCAELFEEEGVVPGIPTSLSAYLSNAELKAKDLSVIRPKRPTEEPVSGREPKRGKAGMGTDV
ncbi:hypothetical protein O1611_g1467 [Lasiodiplodia mahajangana]|uniref:Uncharacterized protein n=1 Tax=Lasiodiplodia mahajangana TaxID=1108764 RepID=A0ACC2JXI2_9PEZI|nr:hypothetical protein O1611_g1467 [Lasiodiplodia mahajangana]